MTTVGFARLVDDCVRHLIETMNEDNVVDSWIFGEACNHTKLRDAALEYLLKLNSADKDPMDCKGLWNKSGLEWAHLLSISN